MNFNTQPTLENENISLQPLQEKDFEGLYKVASDPKVWEQHPNKNRYQQEVFAVYFKGAIESKGAFLILDKITNEIIGSSRYYDYNEKENSILIGYTFIGTKYWGKKINAQIKKLMIDYAFEFVDKIYFHIGANNKRSQIAIGNIGATKVREFEVAYYGEPELLNYEYVIDKPTL
jgi:N-acetyltransferase